MVTRDVGRKITVVLRIRAAFRQSTRGEDSSRSVWPMPAACSAGC